MALAKRLLEANRDRPGPRPPRRRRPGQRLFVYGRAGRPCLRCGTPVRAADQGDGSRERPTYWCPALPARPRPGPGQPNPCPHSN